MTKVALQGERTKIFEDRCYPQGPLCFVLARSPSGCGKSEVLLSKQKEIKKKTLRQINLMEQRNFTDGKLQFQPISKSVVHTLSSWRIYLRELRQLLDQIQKCTERTDFFLLPCHYCEDTDLQNIA